MTDSELLDAAEAYETEKGLWSVRTNKTFSPARFEIIRRPPDLDPVVMASTTGYDTALNEWEEMYMIAAMKAAMSTIKST